MKRHDSFSLERFYQPMAEDGMVWSWVWNGELSREEIAGQLRDFDRAGIRGLYILPEPRAFRPGIMPTYLLPDYMTDEYLALYRYACEEAKRLGMALWLYDEDGWPSGGACGLTEKALPGSAPMALTEDGITQQDCGPNMVDLARGEVTEAFLRCTHEHYAQALDLRAFGMVFTDEPKLLPNAWYEGLPFDRPPTKPEDIIEYKRLLGERFAQAFLQPCADWCHAHGLLFGGHLDHDHLLDGVIGGEMGSGLKLLRMLDVPGVDTIWRQIFPGDVPVGEGCPFFPRFASSAARQNGGELALSESFAVYGEDITLDEMRYTVNYQLVRGINIINPMNMAYGREKGLAIQMRPILRREKPGFFAMTNWMEQVARSCYALRCGHRVCDTALYVPVGDLSVGGEAAARAMASFNALGDALERQCIDFDMIDDEGILQMPEGLYRHIVIPDCEWMPPDVRRIAERCPGQGEPIVRTDAPSLRAIARQAGEVRLTFVFNQSTERVEASHNLSGVRLDLTDGLPKALGERIALEGGEAALIVSGLPIEPVEEIFVPLGELRLQKIGMRRFVLTEDGVSTAMEDGPSGEWICSVQTELAPGRYRLTAQAPGLRMALWQGERKLGDMGTTPQQMVFEYTGGPLTLTVGNDASAEVRTASIREGGCYHAQLLALENPRRTRLLIPQIRIEKAE